MLIDLFNKREEVVTLLEHLSQSSRLVISSVSVAELRAGWSEKQAAIYLPKLYAIADVLPVTQKIGELTGKLRFDYKREGRALPTMDTLIAATAMVHEAVLLTRNRKDFEIIAGVGLYDF